ncbi:MAG: hypothetical protein AAGH87_04810 [Pseudomonadota bacterium]
MTERDRESLAWSLDYAARRLAAAQAGAAPAAGLAGYVVRAVWRAASRELDYLEAMVRRLLLAMASDLMAKRASKPPVDPSGPGAGAKPRPARGERPSAGRPSPRRAVLRLTDRFPSQADLRRQLAASYFEAGCAPPPRPVQPAAAGNSARPAPLVKAAHMAGRFAALAAVLAEPGPAARRMANYVERCGGRQPIRMRRRPALARGGNLDLATGAFIEAERLAVAALDRRAEALAAAGGPAPPQGIGSRAGPLARVVRTWQIAPRAGPVP